MFSDFIFFCLIYAKWSKNMLLFKRQLGTRWYKKMTDIIYYFYWRYFIKISYSNLEKGEINPEMQFPSSWIKLDISKIF